MRLWAWLYTLIWLSAAQILLGFYAALGPVVDAHAAIGIAVVAVAQYDARQLRRSTAPRRLVRIARVSGIFAGIQLLLGIVLFLAFQQGVPIPGVEVLSFVHLLLALAILAQAASVATSYDMWEEREFVEGGDPSKSA